MIDTQRVVVLVALVGVVFASVAVGTVAAQTAPDCSTVTYNGDGTEANPYEVSNVDQLQCIEEQDLGANYVQVSDIDASGTSAWNNGDGFEPIGEDVFIGAFDGANHTISGLTIDRGSTEFVGVFKVVESGRLENVSLENVDITGGDGVGGLAGANSGTVRESYSTGDVSGDRVVGGLVGQTQEGGAGFVGNNLNGNVTESYSTGDVSGNTFVGGLVGNNLNATVRESYATGDVSGNFDVGGLIGGNGGTVERSYATGGVSGGVEVGGLVGINRAGTVTESYATGSVSGNQDAGGLVGVNSPDGSVTNSHWDTEMTGQPTSDGGLGLITSEMTGSSATSNMLGFDFTNTWVTVTNPDDYPILAWQQPTASFTLSTNNPTVNEAITFDASGSSDPDGSIQSYEWDFDGDGNIDAMRQVPLTTHTYTNTGTFAVTLTVTDDDGATGTITETVTVGQGGTLSSNNPFGDANGDPVGVSDASDVLFEWNQNNGVVDGVNISLSDMADFLFGWNQARN